jgi:hypothetical protein
MDAGLQGRLRESLSKLPAGDALTQTDEQAGARGSGGDVPILGLRFPAERWGEVRRRMHLKAQTLPAIEPLDEEGKRAVGRKARSHDRCGVGLQHGAEGATVEGPTHQDGLGLGTVDQLPALADGTGRWKGAAKGGFEGATAPDAILIERLEAQKFVHGRGT